MSTASQPYQRAKFDRICRGGGLVWAELARELIIADALEAPADPFAIFCRGSDTSLDKIDPVYTVLNRRQERGCAAADQRRGFTIERGESLKIAFWMPARNS